MTQITIEPTEAEHEHCYQVALPATDAPMTVGRLTDLLLRERAAVRAELGHELEVERMRLAACGVAAHGGGDVHFENMKIEYNSDALQATRRLRDERDALTAERDKDYQEVRRLQGIVRKQMDQEAEYQERLRLERADKVQYKQDALVLLEKLTELREAAERCITNDLCNCSNAHANLRAVLAKVKP